MELEDDIKQWGTIDNQVKLYQEKIKKLKENRNNISNKILNFVDENNLNCATINISDGRLKFNNTRVTTPLTFKFLEKCLKQCIQGEKQVEQIIKYIKENRDVRYVPDIKRYYNKTN